MGDIYGWLVSWLQRAMLCTCSTGNVAAGCPLRPLLQPVCLAWRVFLHFSERKRRAEKKRGDEGLSLPHFARASVYHIQAPGSDHTGKNGSRAEEQWQGQSQFLPLDLIVMEEF